MSVQPEALAVRLLQEYLLRKLPAKVAEVNATRAAVVKAARAGPYTVPAASSLTIALNRTAAGAEAPITAGSRTAAQIATDINDAIGAFGITASADADGRLVIASGTLPTEGDASCIAVKAADWLGVFGWDLGGEHDTRAALTTPSHKGITDGWSDSPPDMGRTFWIVIGDRDLGPVPPDNRRDETLVTLSCEVWVPDRLGNQHRSKENLGAAIRCIREVLLTGDGRVLGAASSGVMFVAIPRTKISGRAVELEGVVGVLFDVAQLTITIKLFESTA